MRLRAVLPRESARGPAGPLVLHSNPAACTPGSRQFLRRGACPPEKKLLPCSFRARKCAAFQRKLEGGSGGGACSPVHRFLDSLSAAAYLYASAFSLPKNPGELVRAAALSSVNRIRRRVRRIRGNFFGGELAPRRRNCFLAVSAPGNAQHFSGNCEGWKSAGGACSPVHQLV